MSIDDTTRCFSPLKHLFVYTYIKQPSGCQDDSEVSTKRSYRDGKLQRTPLTCLVPEIFDRMVRISYGSGYEKGNPAGHQQPQACHWNPPEAGILRAHAGNYISIWAPTKEAVPYRDASAQQTGHRSCLSQRSAQGTLPQPRR